MSKIRVGILGSTGIVGQRIIQILEGSNKFEITALSGSERNAGKKYGRATQWMVSHKVPDYVSEMEIIPVSEPEKMAESADMVFSCLPSDAGNLELSYARLMPVVSKSSAHRLDTDVPLMIPGLNDDHLSLIERQMEKGQGFISCDPNCSSTQLSIILKAMENFGVKEVFVDSLQAISGAGYPGVPAMEISGNIIPFIQDEEWKMTTEPKKILGHLSSGAIKPKNLKIHAKCSRVDVQDGHTQNLFIKLKEKFDTDDIVDALCNLEISDDAKNCGFFPDEYIHVTMERERPQPRFDIAVNGGMSVVAGRIEKDGDCCKMTTVSHNTILGAAGGAVLHAELLLLNGYL